MCRSGFIFSRFFAFSYQKCHFDTRSGEGGQVGAKRSGLYIIVVTVFVFPFRLG